LPLTEDGVGIKRKRQKQHCQASETELQALFSAIPDPCVSSLLKGN